MFPNANDVSKRQCFQCMFPIYIEPKWTNNNQLLILFYTDTKSNTNKGSGGCHSPSLRKRGGKSPAEIYQMPTEVSIEDDLQHLGKVPWSPPGIRGTERWRADPVTSSLEWMIVFEPKIKLNKQIIYLLKIYFWPRLPFIRPLPDQTPLQRSKNKLLISLFNHF